MAYDNEPVMPNKYLMPDGSITTFDGVVYAGSSDERAQLYDRHQEQAAKWLMPDGSIVAAMPISTETLDTLFVPLTRTINSKALSTNIVLTADDLGIPNPLVYKGAIDCSGNPNYPAADEGNSYIVSVDGKIGGASGVDVIAGDMIICNTDATPSGDEATVGAYWDILEGNIDLTNIVISGGTINGTTIGLTTASKLRSLIDEDVKTSSTSLTANQCAGGLINNYNQTEDVTIPIPAAFEGGNFLALLGTTVTKYFRLDPDDNDSIYLDGVTTGDGKYVGVASAVKGNAIQFVAFQTGDGTYDWYANSINGLWVAEV